MGSIPAGGPIVDESFSTVPGWFFDMCTIQLEPKTQNRPKLLASNISLNGDSKATYCPPWFESELDLSNYSHQRYFARSLQTYTAYKSSILSH